MHTIGRAGRIVAIVIVSLLPAIEVFNLKGLSMLWTSPRSSQMATMVLLNN